MTDGYEVAAYYFPCYHADARNNVWHGPGWTEWDLVRRAESRFPGHHQPKTPAWGYEDEALPEIMAKKIDAASRHGLTAFIFDWYWYEDGPFLERALEEGFLGADNNDRLKFSVMWANHDWRNIHPATRRRPHGLLADGRVSARAFVRATDHVIGTYFSHDSYWRVDGGLYFSVYDLGTLISGLGGVEETRLAFEGFRDRARAHGCGEIHLNLVLRSRETLPGEGTTQDVQDTVERLGFDSLTSYAWVHLEEFSDFPVTTYGSYRKACVDSSQRLARSYRLPYYPNVTMGWDASPRTIQSDVYENIGYPYGPVLGDNTPAEFEKGLRETKAFLERDENARRIVTINAWNEWTEGSYLEPDTVNGTRYLEAIARVFAAD